MAYSRILFVALCAVNLMACSRGGFSAPDQLNQIFTNENPQLRGLWLEKQDADELRATGKLASKCDEIKNHGGVVFNALNIQDSGRVTIYVENPAQRDLILLGTMDFGSNVLTLAGKFKEDFKTDSMKSSIDKGVLSFDQRENNLFIFVSTNEQELERYYKAQHACLK